jgi:cytoskeletal protein CcmA (bactofilin family)
VVNGKRRKLGYDGRTNWSVAMGRIRILVGVLLALAIPAVALAATSDSTNVVLAKGDNKTGTYYVAGQNVTIDGDVAGDVVCAGQSVTINGSVAGDVLCAAQTLTINGPVTGSVRALGQVVTMTSSVGRNATIGAQNFVMATTAKIDGELALGAQTAAINGPIAHVMYVAVRDLTLNSVYGANVSAYVNTLTIGSGAMIKGNLDYTRSDRLPIDTSKVSGTVNFHMDTTQTKHSSTVADWLSSLLYWILSMITGALLAIWLAPRFVRSITNIMVKRWQASLGWGALTLIATPIILLIMCFTVIGFPTAALLAVIWVLALLVSGTIAGVAIGKIAFQRDDTSRRGLALAALGGIPIFLILVAIPVVGAFIDILATAWALGAMMLALNRARVLG